LARQFEPGRQVSGVHDDGTVSGLLSVAARRWSAASAIQDQGGERSYAWLYEAARRIAVWLAVQGVGPGDRVAVRMASHRNTVALMYGVFRSGATLVALDPKAPPYLTGPMLAETEPSVVLDATSDSHVAGLTEIFEQVDAGSRSASGQRCRPVGAGRAAALLLFTSGSTALPKAVICPHPAVRFAVDAIQSRLGYRQDDVILDALPLSFDYGLYQLFLAAKAGAKVVLADPGPALFRQLSQHRATVLPAVPSIAASLLSLAARRSDDVSHLRLITNTGEAIGPAILAQLRGRFTRARLVLMYGLTECKRVSILGPDEDLRYPGSVGAPLAGTRARIVDETGQRVPAGQSGQLWVSGPHVMAGYWRAPELTASKFTTLPGSDRIWLNTGDLGRMSTDSLLYLDGRHDSVYKQNGVRVGALEVESAAAAIPGVERAVLLKPDGGSGAILCYTGCLSATEVQQGLAARLGVAKLPHQSVKLDRIPHLATGKVDRRELRSHVSRMLELGT
jgi:acyl-CoA synthetase (AMP-forming)/AMP-acid ligase II